jgi:hypothetical protein
MFGGTVARPLAPEQGPIDPIIGLARDAQASAAAECTLIEAARRRPSDPRKPAIRS